MTTETAGQPAADSIAQAAIEHASAGAAAPGSQPVVNTDSPSTDAPTVVTVNAFESEDAMLARLEAEQAALSANGGAAATTADPSGQSNVAAPEGAGSPPAGQPADAVAGAAKTSKNTVEGALIALRKQNGQLSRALAVKEGEISVLSRLVDPGKLVTPAGEGGQPAGQPANAQPTIEDELEQIDAKYGEIAAAIDDGRLSERDAEQQRRELRKRERELSAEQAELAAQHVARAPSNDLGLEEHATNLVRDYPVLNTLTAAQLEPFRAIAYQQAELEGKPIQATAAGTKDLRERMARLAEGIFDAPRAAQRAAQRGAAPAVNGGQPARPSAGQRAAKLDMANAMPPNIANMGAGAPAGDLTEEQAAQSLAALTSEDAQLRFLEANPAFVNRVMGRSMRLSR